MPQVRLGDLRFAFKGRGALGLPGIGAIGSDLLG